MVASAYAAYLARRSADYGVTIGGPVGMDMKAVKARKDAISLPSRRGVERSLKQLKGCTVLEGHGHFVGPKHVQVGDEALTADKIFINVGGRAVIPPIRGLDQVSYLTNSSMMDVDFLPPHLIVLGGSYVGLEFAQTYRRFGSEVTVVELAPHLIAREDEDVSRAIAEILKDENIDVRLNSKVVAVGKHGNDIAVTIESGGADRRSLVLISCSRSAGGRIRMISVSTRQALPPIPAATSKSTRSCARMSPDLGVRRLQRKWRLYSHLLERFRDCRG